MWCVGGRFQNVALALFGPVYCVQYCAHDLIHLMFVCRSLGLVRVANICLLQRNHRTTTKTRQERVETMGWCQHGALYLLVFHQGGPVWHEFGRLMQSVGFVE